MSRANETELALLKLIASSMVHIVGKDNVLFVAPYFVEYENGEMAKLRMPELDHPFVDYLGCSDHCVSNNKSLWEKYHEEGRCRNIHANTKIWQHILSLEKEGVERVKAIEIDLAALKGKKEIEEFHVHYSGESPIHSVLVSEVRQSCNTLIAIISVTLRNTDEFKLCDKEKELARYLKFLEKGKYLTIRQELYAALMDVRQWREWRTEYQSNHWGDETHFKTFCGNTTELVKFLRKDYGSDFHKATQPDTHDGRPGLKDLVTIDPGNGRIKRVIENRLAALNRDRYSAYQISVTVENKYDYLWFNALAVADTLFHVIRTYSELPSSPEGGRLWISETQGHNRFVNCTINIHGDETNTNVTADVAIHECGLVGSEIKEERGSNHLKSIIGCATVAGAQSILVRWFNLDSGEFQVRAISPSLEITSVTPPPSLQKDLTGFFFEIKGKFLHDRDKSFAAFLVTEPTL